MRILATFPPVPALRSEETTDDHFDDDGRITHFKVMVRPLKAINLLHRLMGEQLLRQQGEAGVAKSQP